ncbi:MAG TPA: sigma-70 family RNA polymerase sigma factor [Solirubrobacteraceae bacterium]|nr:sigma-70 family RNA polymerase sigma factor [Solirubrobacteraceae bacterium]
MSTETRDRTKLIEQYLPLARKLARRYAGRGELYEDLVQVASVGLIHAVDRFDPERGYAFSTFAVPTILGELKHHFRDTGWAVRMQRGAAEKAHAVSVAAAELSTRRPTVAQLAQYLEWPLEDVVEGLQAAQARAAVSLEAAAGRADPRVELADERMTIAAACRRLPMIERQVLYLRYAEDLSQSAVANRIGVSQMQVSRLERSALGRLRELAAP